MWDFSPIVMRNSGKRIHWFKGFFVHFTHGKVNGSGSKCQVMEGLTQLKDVIQAPYVTNTFLTPWIWLCSFSTDVFESLPIRAAPISCTATPKPPALSNVLIFLKPVAFNISAASCLRFAFAFFAHYLLFQHQKQFGESHLSTSVSCNVILFSW